MKLADFERVLSFAEKEVQSLPFKVAVKPYCSNGRDERGLSFVVSDSRGNYFSTWYSGAFHGAEYLEEAVKETIQRMKREC